MGLRMMGVPGENMNDALSVYESQQSMLLPPHTPSPFFLTFVGIP